MPKLIITYNVKLAILKLVNEKVVIFKLLNEKLVMDLWQ